MASISNQVKSKFMLESDSAIISKSQQMSMLLTVKSEAIQHWLATFSILWRRNMVFWNILWCFLAYARMRSALLWSNMRKTFAAKYFSRHVSKFSRCHPPLAERSLQSLLIMPNMTFKASWQDFSSSCQRWSRQAAVGRLYRSFSFHWCSQSAWPLLCMEMKSCWCQ